MVPCHGKDWSSTGKWLDIVSQKWVSELFIMVAKPEVRVRCFTGQWNGFRWLARSKWVSDCEKLKHISIITAL